MQSRFLAGLVLLTCSLAGCDDPLETHVRELADLGDITDQLFPAFRFEFPDTVIRGERFNVTIQSYGSGSCVRNPTLQTQVGASSVTLTPYIERQVIGPPCTADMVFYYHRSELLLPTPGHWVIRVRGKYTVRFAERDTLVERVIVAR